MPSRRIRLWNLTGKALAARRLGRRWRPDKPVPVLPVAVIRILREWLGIDKVIWLPYGLVEDSGPLSTSGHADDVAQFVAPGVVVAQTCDEDNVNYGRLRENLQVLASPRPSPPSTSRSCSRLRPPPRDSRRSSTSSGTRGTARRRRGAGGGRWPRRPRAPDWLRLREAWEAWEREDGFRVLECVSLDQHVQLLGDVAVFTHRVTTRMRTHAGEEIALERETIVFSRQTGGSWLAVHEHLSPDPQGE